MNLRITNPKDILYEKPQGRKKYKISKSDTVSFSCDNCGKEVTLNFQSATWLIDSEKLLCKSCKSKETNLQRYGVSNPAKSEEIKERTRQNNLKKYGVEYTTQLDSVKEKSKISYMDKYGVDHPLKSKEIREKVKSTNLEKYGVECPFQSQEIIDRIKKDSLEKYGTLSPSQTEEAKKKRKNTILNKYGEESIFKTDYFKSKSKETCNLKYGTDFSLQSEYIRNKIKNTCIEKYGVENVSSLKSTREKIKNTLESKYGVSCTFKSEEIKNKIKNTNIKKYGVPNIGKSEEIRDKIKATCIEKYGSSSYLSSEVGKERIKKTLKDKYNVENISQLDSIKKKISNTNFIERYPVRLNFWKSRDLTPLFNIEQYKDALQKDKRLSYRCNICNNEFSVRAVNRYPICRKCHPLIKGFSVEEKEVVNFIQSIYEGNIIENDRDILKPKELDIYIPDKKVAIEFNGVYWHSKYDKNYRLNKTEECNKLGIRLIHINKYDWTFKKDICKSIIASSLNIYQEKIYARNCICKEIDSKTYREFLEDNHISGSVNSSIRLGLFYKNRLVQVAGWGKSRFKKDEIELHRMCTLLNIQVIGGFSKLVKHSGISDFISYVDRSLYNGSGYFKLGFDQLDITPPSYKYFNNEGESYSRFETQKHKLKNLLKDKFDENLTEEENMLNAGFFKIYDCGNLKLEYKK